MTEKIVSPLIDETSQTGGTGQRCSRSVGKLEIWVGREFSCWGMCGVTVSCTLHFLQETVCFLSLRGFAMTLSVLSRLTHKVIQGQSGMAPLSEAFDSCNTDHSTPPVGHRKPLFLILQMVMFLIRVLTRNEADFHFYSGKK